MVANRSVRGEIGEMRMCKERGANVHIGGLISTYCRAASGVAWLQVVDYYTF